MAILVQEKLGSPRVTMGVQPSVDVDYVILNAPSEALAKQALLANSYLAYDVFGDNSVLVPRDSAEVHPAEDPYTWFATVHYARTNEPIFAFDLTGGQGHITHSKYTTGGYRRDADRIADPEGSAPTFHQAIGWDGDSIQGVDVIIPVYKFTETHYFTSAFVTAAYKARVARCTSKVNDAAFKGFERGEVLFFGATGQRKGLESWEITYHFAAAENIRTVPGDPNYPGLTVGTIHNIQKEGWEYLWVFTEPTDSLTTKKLIPEPIYAYTERVYDYADLSQLGIGV